MVQKKMFLVFGWAVLGAVLIGSCASRGGTLTADEKEAAKNNEVIDYKGASFGLPKPEWVVAHQKGGNLGVERLPLYKDKYCFVVEYNDASRDFAVAWVNGASGPQQIAQKVATTVASVAENNESIASGADKDAAVKTVTTQLSDAAFTGMTKEMDFWQITRNKKTKDVECRAYALWVIGKKILDEQIVANIQNIMDNNKAMSAAEREIYARLIEQILFGGIVNS
jgi:hypothetical protein